jgi:hypothetical protein
MRIRDRGLAHPKGAQPKERNQGRKESISPLTHRTHGDSPPFPGLDFRAPSPPYSPLRTRVCKGRITRGRELASENTLSFYHDSLQPQPEKIPASPCRLLQPQAGERGGVRSDPIFFLLGAFLVLRAMHGPLTPRSTFFPSPRQKL